MESPGQGFQFGWVIVLFEDLLNRVVGRNYKPFIVGLKGTVLILCLEGVMVCPNLKLIGQVVVIGGYVFNEYMLLGLI